MPEILLQTRDLTREYRVGRGTVTALGGLNIAIEQGEFVAVMGDRKSTRLNSSHRH